LAAGRKYVITWNNCREVVQLNRTKAVVIMVMVLVVDVLVAVLVEGF